MMRKTMIQCLNSWKIAMASLWTLTATVIWTLIAIVRMSQIANKHKTEARAEDYFKGSNGSSPSPLLHIQYVGTPIKKNKTKKTKIQPNITSIIQKTKKNKKRKKRIFYFMSYLYHNRIPHFSCFFDVIIISQINSIHIFLTIFRCHKTRIFFNFKSSIHSFFKIWNIF